MWTTHRVSKILPMTKEQAFDFIQTFLKSDLESRNKMYVETENNTHCISLIADYLTSERRKTGLILCGDVGNGKTSLLRTIALVYSFLSYEGYIDNSSESIFKFVNARDIALSVSNKTEYDEYKKCQKLIIDDLGEEAVEVPIFGINHYPIIELLEHRYEHNLLTLISTNLSPKGITDKYHDKRLTDRMREMFDIVVFNDKSFRI